MSAETSRVSRFNHGGLLNASLAALAWFQLLSQSHELEIDVTCLDIPKNPLDVGVYRSPPVGRPHWHAHVDEFRDDLKKSIVRS